MDIFYDPVRIRDMLKNALSNNRIKCFICKRQVVAIADDLHAGAE